MPHPRKVLGELNTRAIAELDIGEAAIQEKCLRGTTGHFDLMMYFLKVLVTSKVYKVSSRKLRLTEYVKPSLEAFLVLTYVNSYGCWMKAWEDKFPVLAAKGEHLDPDPGVATDGEITIYNGRAKLFTSDAKGKGKLKGWSEEGLALHRKMADVIRAQRGGLPLGGLWEDRLKSAFGKDIVEQGRVAPQVHRGADDSDDFFRDTGNDQYIGMGRVAV
jgi:hypothetical protein